MQRTTLFDHLSGVSWRRWCYSERLRGGDYLPSLHSAPFALQKDTSKAAIFKVVDFDHFKTFFCNRGIKSKLFRIFGASLRTTGLFPAD